MTDLYEVDVTRLKRDPLDKTSYLASEIPFFQTPNGGVSFNFTLAQSHEPYGTEVTSLLFI